MIVTASITIRLAGNSAGGSAGSGQANNRLEASFNGGAATGLFDVVWGDFSYAGTPNVFTRDTIAAAFSFVATGSTTDMVDIRYVLKNTHAGSSVDKAIITAVSAKR